MYPLCDFHVPMRIREYVLGSLGCSLYTNLTLDVCVLYEPVCGYLCCVFDYKDKFCSILMRFVSMPWLFRYAEESPDPAHALAGRWAAKEAVIKALSSLQEEGAVNLWVDASAPLKDIEVIRTTGGEWVGVVGVVGVVVEKSAWADFF